MRRLVLNRHTLGKILRITACTVFAVSIIFPFHHRTYTPIMNFPEFSYSNHIYYWSFLVSQQTIFVSLGRTVRDYWIFEADFHQWDPGPSLSWLFVLIFAFQIMCLPVGVVSVLISKRILVLAPVALNSLVSAGMLYANKTLSESTIQLHSYPLGYWLTHLSLLLFLLACILTRSIKK